MKESGCGLNDNIVFNLDKCGPIMSLYLLLFLLFFENTLTDNLFIEFDTVKVDRN